MSSSDFGEVKVYCNNKDNMMVRATEATAIVINPVISRAGEVALLIRLDGSHRQNVWLCSSDRQESK